MSTSSYRPVLVCTSVLLAVALVGAAVAASYPAPVQKAIQRLAGVLEVNPEAIEVVSHEFMEWPDSSLGVPRLGYGYLPVITAGYKVILAHAGRRYEYHTDLKDRVVLAASGTEPTIHTGAPAQGVADGSPGVALCRADLAQRLKVAAGEISVAKVVPARFFGGALGLPRPGMAYTKAIESGLVVTLQYRAGQYLYTTTAAFCRYGGPLEARQASALYLSPIDNEPNLNGNLMQIALAGDNERLVLEGVSDFRPQPDGSVTAKRRTSRSTHDLFYLAPGKYTGAVKLGSAMDFTDAAVSPDGKRWAAIVRPRLGTSWQLLAGATPEPVQGEGPSLPAGLPQRVYLHMGAPVVQMLEEGKLKSYQLSDGAFRPVSFFPPDSEEMMLHKSATLVLETKEVNGLPVTRVISKWFNGDQNVRATIENFRPKECQLTPGKRFVLLSGKRGEKGLALTVDLETGEVLDTLAEAYGPARLLLAPSAGPLMMVPGAQ